MWQEKQTQLLRDEINSILTLLADGNNLYELAREPLSQVRRGLVLDASYDRPWPLLPLIVCEVISGRYKQAVPAAAAFQLLVAAGDVFDDIEDADSYQSLSTKYGSAVATNVATTLLILAERGITRLKSRGVDDYTIVSVMDAINSYYTTACIGQHLDLYLTVEDGISEDTYLKITGMKSATQIECACHIGALLADANKEQINTCSLFGYNLGMAAQINNDIQGIIKGSHIKKCKASLPIIYALTQADGEDRNQLKSILSYQSETVIDPDAIPNLLFRTGAIHYATIKMELYRQLALDLLSTIQDMGFGVERLKLFLE